MDEASQSRYPEPMIRGLGYSNTTFNPSRPGRLCRGREVWVKGWEEEETELHRFVFSGALFSDDSAREAQRGLSVIEVDVGALLEALFPGAPALVFVEDGSLADVPDYAESREEYFAELAGGRLKEPCCRWRAEVTDRDELSRLILSDEIAGALIGAKWPPSEELEEALYLLTSFSDSSCHPFTRFQPLAMAAVLEHCDVLVCVHQDKHGPAVALYSREKLAIEERLEEFAKGAGLLPVPFAIPPMLARWDRALYELRVAWRKRGEGEFPVPPAVNSSRWGHHKDRGRGEESEEE